MKIWLILIHLGIICIFIASILGIGFGFIYPSVKEVNKYKETICYLTSYENNTYNYCYQLCNTTIPSCDYLLSNNISGKCYNETNEEHMKFIQCFIECDQYVMLNITFNYTTLNNNTHISNVNYDCQNNLTCLNILSPTVKCYYKINDPSIILLLPPENYKWEFLALIIILGILMTFYIIVNMTIFKKYNIVYDVKEQ
jgi:hypothetical protein